MKKTNFWAVLFILVGAFAMRIWGIKYGFPNIYCIPDEDISVRYALRFASGNFNYPLMFWPVLYYYILIILYGIYFFTLKVLGTINSVADFRIFYFMNQPHFYLIARMVNVLSGTGAVWIIYLLGKKIYSAKVGILSSLFLAFAYLHIINSHFARPDILAFFFAALSCYYGISLKRKRDYILTGIFAGLAASTKYQYGFVLFPLFANYVFVRKHQGVPLIKTIFEKNIYLTLLASSATFLITFPYAFNFPVLVKKIISVYGLTKVHGSWARHFNFSLWYGLGWPILILSLIGLIRTVLKKDENRIFFIVFVLTYYLIIAGNPAPRYALLLFIPLCVLSAEFLSVVFEKYRLKKIFQILIAGAVILPGSYHSCRHNLLISRTDTRIIARKWIENNIPTGSRIMMGTGFWPAGFPILPETKQSIRNKPKAEHGHRFSFLLNSPSYAPNPAYNIFQAKGRVILWWKGLPINLNAMAKEGIEYVITQEYFFKNYSGISPRLASLLKKHFYLIKEISPFRPGTRPHPIVNKSFAYYVPYIKFKDVLRPGPLIKIWKIKTSRFQHKVSSAYSKSGRIL